MDLRAHRITQRAVNRLMALHQGLALEVLAYHESFEVIAAPGEIADFNMSPGQALLDKFLELVSLHFVTF